MAENETADTEQEAPSPLAIAQRRQRRWQWLAIASVVVACCLLGITMVLSWQGIQVGQQALRELPEYRVVALTRDYETVAQTLEDSYQNTQDLLVSESAQQTLTLARQLPEQLLMAEQAHQATLSNYGQAVLAAAADIPGSREWRRYFNGQIEALVVASESRQAALTAILTRYPAVAETDESTTDRVDVPEPR